MPEQPYLFFGQLMYLVVPPLPLCALPTSFPVTPPYLKLVTNFESMYEKIQRRFVKEPAELKSLGFPLLASDYWPRANWEYGVYIHCPEIPQVEKIKQVLSVRRHQRELELCSLGYAWSRKRYCDQCTFPFLVDLRTGDYLLREMCTHHWGKLYTDNQTSRENWTCCGAPGDGPGCIRADNHVWSGLVPGDNGPFFDFIRTQPTQNPYNCSIYALDCEMVLTKWGRELARVTLVDMDGDLVYESLVRPRAEVLDYCTRFSGIRSEDLAGISVTLEQVQREILKYVSAETILVGHGLANDLRALKILHYRVVDTCAVFPHSMGLPYRNSLKMLALKHLGVRIQKGEHNPVEDAATAAQLIRSKLQSKNPRDPLSLSRL